MSNCDFLDDYYKRTFPDQFMENLRIRRKIQSAFFKGALFGGGLVTAVFLYFVI